MELGPIKTILALYLLLSLLFCWDKQREGLIVFDTSPLFTFLAIPLWVASNSLCLLHLFWWLSSKTLWLLLILTEIYSAFQIFLTLKLRFHWTLKFVASIVSARSHICNYLPPVLLNINMKPENFGETVKVLDFSKSLWKVLRGRDIKVGTCAPSSENPLKIRPTLQLRQLWQRSPWKNSKLDLSFYISWPENYWYFFCFLHWT